MKTALFLSALCVAALTACGGSSTNVNVNANHNSNGSTAGNAMNTVSNTVSNAANTIANTASSMTTASPDSFMKDAAEGGLAEVELGKIAAKNAQDPEVKKFGQMMVADHTKANAELKALAAKKNVELPTEPASYKSDIQEMSGKKGADFDKDYVEMMASDHETTVADFEAQAKNSADPDVKAFAEKSLPILRKHLETIKAIQAKMNK